MLSEDLVSEIVLVLVEGNASEEELGLGSNSYLVMHLLATYLIMITKAEYLQIHLSKKCISIKSAQKNDYVQCVSTIKGFL